MYDHNDDMTTMMMTTMRIILIITFAVFALQALPCLSPRIAFLCTDECSAETIPMTLQQSWNHPCLGYSGIILQLQHANTVAGCHHLTQPSVM